MRQVEHHLLSLTPYRTVKGWLGALITLIQVSTVILPFSADASQATAAVSTADSRDLSGQLSQMNPTQELWEAANSAWENDYTGIALHLLAEAIDLSPADAELFELRGRILLDEGKYADAVKDLRAAAKMLPGSPTAHGNLGRALLLEGAFLESRQASMAAHNLDPIAWEWLFNIGHSYLLLGDIDTARQYYNSALPLIPELSEIESLPWASFDTFATRGWPLPDLDETRDWVRLMYPDYAEHRSAISLMWSTIDQQNDLKYEDALKTSLRAIQQLEKLFDADHLILAWAHYYVGSSHHLLGDYKAAENHYLKALAIPKQVLGDESPYTADFANDLASLYLAMGEYEQAEALFENSLKIAEESLGPDHDQTGIGLSKLGELYSRMGRYSQAETLLLKSLALSERSAGPLSADVASDLNSLAWLYHSKGAYSDAQEAYLKSLHIFRQLYGEDSLDFASAESNLALLYQDLGDYEPAKELLEHSLEVTRRTLGNDSLHTAIAIHNLASLRHEMSELDEAEALYLEGISIAQKTLGSTHPDMAVDFHNVARLYRDIGNFEQALNYFERALAISQSALGTDHPNTVITTLEFAEFLHGQGQSSRAQLLFERIPPVPLPGRSPEALAYLQYGWATRFAREEDLATAIFFGKQAINTLQEFRGTLTELEKKLQQSFVSSRTFFYRDLATWLIDSGRLAEAQQVLEMQKEDEFFQYIQRSSAEDPRQTRATYDSAEAIWAARYQEIKERLVSISAEYQRLREQKSAGLTPAEERHLKALEVDMRVGRMAFMSFQEEIREEYFAQGIERAMELAKKDIDLDSQERISAFLDSLDIKAGLLTYVVGENRLRILLTLPGSPPILRESPISAKELRQQVYAFRTLLQDPYSDPIPAARELYRSLIAPVAADLLQTQIETILLQLDDVLRYIPFAALHDGDEYLIQKYALAIYTPGARQSSTEVQTRKWRVAGLGFSEGSDNFSALPYVSQELDAIVLEGDTSDSLGVVGGVVKLDGDFTAESLSELLHSEGFSVLHVATHFVFRPGTVDDSYMVLGKGQKLSLNDLRVGDFPFFGLDLIALSACETALGVRNADGREMEGFGALAQSRGAASVMATLWPVSDLSTAYLMVQFYSQRETRGTTKADSLRLAQMEFVEFDLERPAEKLDFSAVGLRGAGEQTVPDKDMLRHPYFWAPFILMGDWL